MHRKLIVILLFAILFVGNTFSQESNREVISRIVSQFNNDCPVKVKGVELKSVSLTEDSVIFNYSVHKEKAFILTRSEKTMKLGHLNMLFGMQKGRRLCKALGKYVYSIEVSMC